MKKITRIKFDNHPVLKDSEIKLVDDGESNNTPYISFIIGQNGTGKSKILEAICDILRFLKRKKESSRSRWTESYDFEIDIEFNNKTYTLKTVDRSFSFPDNLLFEADFLPSNIIVSAYTFNDKFPKLGDEQNFYIYCGLRTATNNIFVNKPSEDCFYNLVDILKDEDKLNLLNVVFLELEFTKKISVTYIDNRNKTILFDKSIQKILRREGENEISANDVEVFRNAVIKRTKIGKVKKEGRFQETSIHRFLNDDERIKRVIDYLTKNDLFSQETRGNKIEQKFTYCWNKELEEIDKVSNSVFLSHLEIYEALREIEIVRFDHFNVYKDDSFDFNQASSGEYHILHLFSSILKNIDKESIVIIDEPEISLHPNWQNKFLHILKPLTESYSDNQYFIASHSHLMVSSLQKANSSIITLKKEDGEITVKNLDKINTFGWSAEQILFDVFGMVTDRNFYLSKMLQEIIDEMSKINPNHNLIKELKIELSNFDRSGLNREDPLYAIIEKILS